MLILVFAHAGRPPAPHDLWGAWNLEPILLIGLLLTAVTYAHGRPRGVNRWRTRSFAAALGAVALALVSPLDALSRALASAHMVQHVLLVLVAAPLLAFSAPSSALLRGSPLVVRRAAGRWGRRLGLTGRIARALRQPVPLWVLHVVTLWFWHAAVPYDAALDHELLHVVEHAGFLVTGVLFWRAVIGARGRGRVPAGAGVLLVFGMAMQSVLLSVLLTFANEPWYSGYTTTTAVWGLDQLADQQLAGAIMWVPAGLIYVGIALSLLLAWLRASESGTVKP